MTQTLPPTATLTTTNPAPPKHRARGGHQHAAQQLRAARLGEEQQAGGVAVKHEAHGGRGVRHGGGQLHDVGERQSGDVLPVSSECGACMLCGGCCGAAAWQRGRGLGARVAGLMVRVGSGSCGSQVAGLCGCAGAVGSVGTPHLLLCVYQGSTEFGPCSISTTSDAAHTPPTWPSSLRLSGRPALSLARAP